MKEEIGSDSMRRKSFLNKISHPNFSIFSTSRDLFGQRRKSRRTIVA